MLILYEKIGGVFVINNENWINSINFKKMNNIKWGFSFSLIIFIVGCCFTAFGKYFGIGLMFGGVTVAIINIVRALRLIEEKMKQTEDKIKKLEKEIEFLKNK